MDINYSYISDEEEQYDATTFAEGVPVKARYRRASNEFDRGNPYIEALPEPREGRDTLRAYTVSVRGIADSIGAKRSDILSQVTLLRQLRFPLPFHQRLEDECYTSIINSYRDRHVIEDKNVDLNVGRINDEMTTHQVLVGDVAAATDAGFHMIGYSGCGKSSALKILFANYPQYIVHERDDDTRFPQITYLVVTCQANSNFKALYESIGRAIDRAIGNITPVYEVEIRKASGLAGKADLVRRYIEQFAIGIIIFDEIQLIDFDSTKENSFEGLMTLANQTKVAIAVVGTEDAYDRMFTKLRSARRLGSKIEASAYCGDKDYFRVLTANLFKYQWFDEKITVTNELVDALYSYSAGIVDQLIGIYMYMTLDYLTARNKPEIDAKYVEKTVMKHYPGMQAVLADMTNPINDAKRVEIVKKANTEMERMIDSAKQEQFKNEILSGLVDVEQEQTAIDKVVQTISLVTDAYNRKSIEKEAQSILKTKAGQNMTQQDLTRKVMERLKSKTSDRRPNGKRPKKTMDEAHIEMKNFLEE